MKQQLGEFFRANPAEKSGTEDRFYCTLCSNSYSSIYGLKKHITFIHDQKFSMPMSCDMCRKMYKNKRSLMEHIRNSHTKDMSCHCRFCNAKFKMTGTRNGDSVVSTGNNKQRYQCRLCPKSYSFRSALTSHWNNCHGKDAQPMLCNFCNRFYKNRNRLVEHMRLIHTGRDVVCGVRYSCGYADSMGTIRQQRYSCEKWHQPRSLNEHWHNAHVKNATPMICNYCQKAYKNKGTLTQHLSLMHTGKNVQRYPCRYCDHTFTRGSNRNAHERNVHKI
ncbi:hypothetical protein B566_EDAN018152 [Ephemera danica]|nr:hypothetical protein B566_EDAN018152 [Ephemera danica]